MADETENAEAREMEGDLVWVHYPTELKKELQDIPYENREGDLLTVAQAIKVLYMMKGIDCQHDQATMALEKFGKLGAPLDRDSIMQSYLDQLDKYTVIRFVQLQTGEIIGPGPKPTK